MADLTTNYMGFKLKNPIIAGSSGLTKSLDNIKLLEKNGAAAVVLKSLFEEQIMHEINKVYSESQKIFSYPEAEDYISNYSKGKDVGEYLQLISDAKKSVSVPVIASINCATASEWIHFAKLIENAGADGLELNIFILPSDPMREGAQNEQIYFDIVTKVMKQISIPVAIKMSYYFSGLAKMALKLSWTGIAGMVLFNRFFSPDINIESFEVTSANVFSSKDELFTSLRWVAMLSDRVHCDIAASTGIYDGESVVKQMLAGAKAVEIASVLYKNGFSVIGEMLGFIDKWMDRQHFEKTSDFVGKMSLKAAVNPAAYERVQFMKHFSGIE
jgi:dihydroorotate dehydrogenase (fumarate)